MKINNHNSIIAVLSVQNFIRWAPRLLSAVVLLPTALPVRADYSPPTSGLVGWWRGDGNANDSSGNGHNGTLVNGMGFAAGLFNQAFQGGENQRVLVPDSPAFQLTSSLTIAGFGNLRSGYAILQYGDNRPGLDPYQLSGDGAGHMVFQIETAAGASD